MADGRSLRGSATFAGWLIATLCAAGCSDAAKPTEPDERTVARLQAVTETSGTGTVGRGVTAPTVRVTNHRGLPVSGVKVTFSAEGSGSVAHANALTDSAGTASAGVWTLGTGAGVQTVSAAAA